MTVGNQTLRNDYTGNGVASTFAYDYPILSSADLKVIKVLIASPYTATTLTLNTDYSVAGVGEQDGSITLVAGALSSLYTLHILINPDVTQEATFATQSSSNARTWEDAFDSVLNVCKRVWRLALASIRIPEYEDPATYSMELPGALTRKNKIVGFDSTGQLDLKSSGDVDDLTAEFAATNTYTNTTTAAVNTYVNTTATAINTNVTALNTSVQASLASLAPKYLFCCPITVSTSTAFPVIPCESGSVTTINTSIQTAMVGVNGTAVFQLIHLGNMAIASNFATVTIPVNTTSVNTSFNAVATNTSVGMTTVFTTVGNTTAGTNVTHKVK